jgi:hypothetical protein
MHTSLRFVGKKTKSAKSYQAASIQGSAKNVEEPILFNCLEMW